LTGGKKEKKEEEEPEAGAARLFRKHIGAYSSDLFIQFYPRPEREERKIKRGGEKNRNGSSRGMT